MHREVFFSRAFPLRRNNLEAQASLGLMGQMSYPSIVTESAILISITAGHLAAQRLPVTHPRRYLFLEPSADL